MPGQTQLNLNQTGSAHRAAMSAGPSRAGTGRLTGWTSVNHDRLRRWTRREGSQRDHSHPI